MAVHLLSTTVHHTMPGNYVRPETQQRGRLAEVVSGARIPVVDLASPDRAAVVAAICGACRTHGFFQFQVLNHGIDAGLIADVMAVAREFFRLPAEEKAKLYSDDPARNIRLFTSFNVRKETVHNWRDYLRLHCHPLDPETMSSNCKEVRELGFQLHAAMSESIGLEPGYMKDTLGEQDQHMAVNFNPPCPSPELTCGLLAHHTDPNANALTILLMDEDVAGLQVLHGGKWVAVNPHPGALIVGIDDDHLLQVRVEKSAAKAGDPIPRGVKKASGEDDGRGGDGHRRGRGSLAAVLGIVAASSAVQVAVGAITPVVVVGSAVVMFAGVSMVMAGFLQV